MNTKVGDIISVITNNYCIGCGACAVYERSPFKVVLNNFGQYKATHEDNLSNIEDVYSKVCPFSNFAINEDKISKILEFRGDYLDGVGYYQKLYCGHVKEGMFRKKGSSGGLGTWIPYEMLRKRMVDGIIHVKPTFGEDTLLFKYSLTHSYESATEGAKSRYYPVEFSNVIKKILKKTDRKYIFMGIPCFVKAIRLLSIHDKQIQERIPYVGSIFCGHLKSTFYAESMAWESGINPNNLKDIDFRKKLKFLNANHYGVEIVGTRNKKQIKRSNIAKAFIGGDWGAGLFKYRACDFCDDIVGETSDFSIGDAWIDKYVKDSMGNNVLIVRNPLVLDLVERAKFKGKLKLEEISGKSVIKSQRAGYKNKRKSIAYRLCHEISIGSWVPTKRIEPSCNNISNDEKAFQDMRKELSQKSLEMFKKAKENKDVRLFCFPILKLLKKYYLKKKNRLFFSSWQAFRFFSFRINKLISIFIK